MSEHTHHGDGTVPGASGEPILTPTFGCRACAEAMERHGISVGGNLPPPVHPADPRPDTDGPVMWDWAAPRRPGGMPIGYSASIQERLRYDMDEGRLVTESFPDGVIRHAIEVRKTLEDDVLLQAVVIELERRGYTVISPGASGD